MFRLESYITNIIQANADRYIKNFRKQDAQVSLWEGDASFHNIELDVDALNEELQFPFAFTSGYIHDLVIHVPWTKITSESVTVSVNTMECVMKFKTDTIDSNKSKRNLNKSEFLKQKYKDEETAPPPSYISSLTRKIMNNLLFQCKNFILKLVEEDIVLSMNIEKLTLYNVNENWEPAFTAETSFEELIVRKLVDLCGVTVCLDKQNVSGRIESYLEPILYRCPMTIRMCRYYGALHPKEPPVTRIDVFSDKMFFTFSEPQIPMLIGLFTALNAGRKHVSPVDVDELDETKSHSSSMGCIDFTSNPSINGNEEQSWSYWLWNMMPSLLPSAEEGSETLKHGQKTSSSVLFMGLYVRCLETVLKFPSPRPKKISKIRYSPLLKGVFNGCMLRVVIQNSKWLNAQLGASFINISSASNGEPLSADNIFQFIISGIQDSEEYLRTSLFNTKEQKQRRKDSYHDQSESSGSTVTEDDTDKRSNVETNASDAIKEEVEFSKDDHLTKFSENALLDETPAFSADYIRYEECTVVENENSTVTDYSEDAYISGSSHKGPEKRTLLRLIFGATKVQITSQMIESILAIYDVAKTCEYFNHTTASEPQSEDIKDENSNITLPVREIQCTCFDLNVSLYPAVCSGSSCPFAEHSMCPGELPFLSFLFKCLDAKQTSFVVLLATRNDWVFSHQTLFATVVSMQSSINLMSQHNWKSEVLLSIEKLDFRYEAHNAVLCQTTREASVDLSKGELSCSKPDLLLASSIVTSSCGLLVKSQRTSIKCATLPYLNLINDSFAESGSTFLELSLSCFRIKYKTNKRITCIRLRSGGCIAYMCKHLTTDRSLRVPVLTPNTSTPRFEVYIQMLSSDAEGVMNRYPRCLFFNISSFSLNLDPLLVSWLLYFPPSVKEIHLKADTPANTSSRNTRKVSDSSSNSYPRRLVPSVTVYPKPEETVHNSSEPEISSTPIVDVTESDYTTCSSDASSEPKLSQLTPIQKILKFYPLWNGLAIMGEITALNVYVPNYSLVCKDLELRCVEDVLRIESICTEDDESSGLLSIELTSLKMKCAIGSQVLEQLTLNMPVLLPDDFSSRDVKLFPWTLDISDFILKTVSRGRTVPLLDPFSLNCTLNLTPRQSEDSEQQCLALYVHLDVQPINLHLNNSQVLLLSSVISNPLQIYELLHRTEDITDKKTLTVTHVSEASSSCVPLQYNKLAGWVQCTASKFSLSLYDNAVQSESSKLIIDIEDSILSAEFDDVFHKIKLKVSNFVVNLYVRTHNEENWCKGPFCGVVVKQRNSDFSKNSAKSIDESKNRFLVATVTRARYNHLQSRVNAGKIYNAQSEKSEKVDSEAKSHHFVSELIINMCPIDFVFSPSTLKRYLSVIVPLLAEIDWNRSTDSISQSAHEFQGIPNKYSLSSFHLPLLYFDTCNLRIFLPAVGTLENDLHCDVLNLEIGCIHIDSQPENLISRKPAQLGLHSQTGGKELLLFQSSELSDRQYQLVLKDVHTDVGTWSKLRDVLDEERHSLVLSVRGILQENPAVMWNQGCQPTDDSVKSVQTRPLTSKFSCHVLFAPSVKLLGGHVLFNTSCEVVIKPDVTINLTMQQMALITAVYAELRSLICNIHDIVNVQKQKITELRRNFARTSATVSSITDSGISSLGQSPVGSSVYKKRTAKSGVHVPDIHSLSSSKRGRSSAEVLIPSEYNTATSRIKSVADNVSKEIFISVPNIALILYSPDSLDDIAEKDSEQDESVKGLFLLELTQPAVLLHSSDCLCVEVSFFKVSLKLPKLTMCKELPTKDDFDLTFFTTYTANYAEYTEIPYAGFVLTAESCVAGMRKMNISVGQPILFLPTLSHIEYVRSTASGSILSYQKYLKDFLINLERDTVTDVKDRNVAILDTSKRYSLVFPEVNIVTKQLIFELQYDVTGKRAFLVCKSLSVSLFDMSHGEKNVDLVQMECALEGLALSKTMEVSNEVLKRILNMSNLILNPVNIEFKIVSNYSLDALKSKTANIHSSDIILNVSPSNVECLKDLFMEYKQWISRYMSKSEIPEVAEGIMAEETCDYKDDLRAGAFQHIRVDDKQCVQPSPYEAAFCNKPGEPYVCWSYPQPRTMKKLQLYPTIVEVINDNKSSQICGELQYYDNVLSKFRRYVEFTLPTDLTLNVPLPTSDDDLQVSTCWRIQLRCAVFVCPNSNELCNVIDITSLAGCIRVDSLFQPSLVPEFQMHADVSSLQVNVYSESSTDDCSAISFDGYRIGNPLRGHKFLTFIMEKCWTSFLIRQQGAALKMSSTVTVNMLDYENLLQTPFIEGFPLSFIYCVRKGTERRISLLTESIDICLTQPLLHSLSVGRWMWEVEKEISGNILSVYKPAMPYIICNSTNCLIKISQEDTEEDVYIQPTWAHLYAWLNISKPKMLKFSLFCDEWKFTSSAVNVKKEGKRSVKCYSGNDATCFIFVDVVSISPVVKKVIICGSLDICNESNEPLELLLLANPKKSHKANKNSPLSTGYQLSNTFAITPKSGISAIVPSNYIVWLKVRFCSDDNTTEKACWSGLIPLNTMVQDRSGSRSWLVKVPLKDYKEHFQSIWCDVLQEATESVVRILVVLKPLCSVRSYLPWESQLNVLNENGVVIGSAKLGCKGEIKDLFAPNILSLDNYCVQWLQSGEGKDSASLTLVKPFSKINLSNFTPTIDELLVKLKQESRAGDKWPFVDENYAGVDWKIQTDCCNITPVFQIHEKLSVGVGLSVVVSPSILITSTFGDDIFIEINSKSYCLQHFGLLIPPDIEDVLEVKLKKSEELYYSTSFKLLENDNSASFKGVVSVPQNGFTSMTIDCEDYVSLLNVKSKIVNDTRIVNVCCPYIIANRSSKDVMFASFLICRTNDTANLPINVPDNISEIATCITRHCASGQTITKWTKVGNGETQILPYLLFVVDGCVGCPVRICDLSEKYSYSLIFLNNPAASSHPSLNLTAHHKEGQIFVTVCDDLTPHVTLHNNTELTLSVLTSKNEQGTQLMYDCVDWNWKFHCSSGTVTHYRFHNVVISRNNLKPSQQYLVFAVHNKNYVKSTKWSKGVLVRPCVDHLVLLPFSQRHITVSIYRDGFTYVVLLEPSSVSKLPMVPVRSRLLTSHFGLGRSEKGNKPNEQQHQQNTKVEKKNSALDEYYSDDILKIPKITIAIQSVRLKFSLEDEHSRSCDIFSLTMDDIVLSSKSFRKQYEVKSETSFYITVSGYQIDNEEYLHGTYDFPVVLLNKQIQPLPHALYQTPCIENVDQVLSTIENNQQALSITLNAACTSSCYDLRDIEIKLLPLCAYIEDKFITRMSTLLESTLHTALTNSISVYITPEPQIIVSVELQGVVQSISNLGPCRTKLSCSSKSVNLSELKGDKHSVEDYSRYDVSVIKDTNVTKSQKQHPGGIVECQKSKEDLKSPFQIPKDVVKLSESATNIIKLRRFSISPTRVTLSVHTSTSFYIALDHSPLNFSEFSKEYITTSMYQLGQFLTVHYMMGAIYGTGWVISSLEFVGSPGGLARTVGTGIKDFVSLPVYGISSGPQGFFLGIAHGSASLVKHLVAGTVTSVTKFTGSWARTLDRFTLDADDLLQSELTRRQLPSGVTEGIMQGLTEFGISLLGGISGIAHHPLQYAVSGTADNRSGVSYSSGRSLLNSISLGVVGIVTRPLSGAAELVARTGQGILSHVGWNPLPQTRQSVTSDSSALLNTELRYELKVPVIPEIRQVLLVSEGAIDAGKIELVTLVFTDSFLYILEAETDRYKDRLSLIENTFEGCKNDNTLIEIKRNEEICKEPEDYNRIRVYRHIEETNRCLGIKSQVPCFQVMYKIHVSPDIREFILILISFLKTPF